MWNTLTRTIALMTREEKRRGGLLLILVVLMAMFETFGIAALLPFFQLLSDPDALETNKLAKNVYEWSGLDGRHNFLTAVGFFAFGIIISAATIRIVTTYAMNLYAQVGGHHLAERLLSMYLRQPYEFFLEHHSSDLTKKIMLDSQSLVSQILQPGMYVIAYTLVLMIMTSMMLALDPVLALAVGGVIGSLYVLIYQTIKRLLSRLGRDLEVATKERFSAIDVAFGGIKDIKLLGRENVYLDQFRPASLRCAQHQATNATLGESPRYLIEAVAIGGALALALVLLATSSGSGIVLPGLSVYALAGYKLIPAAQRIYSGLSNLRFGEGTLDSITADFNAEIAFTPLQEVTTTAILPKLEIVLDNVVFAYPKAKKNALNGVELIIPVGASIGLVGGTGAGKTTLVDIILGLLRPTDGQLIVDGQAIDDHNLRAWQQALGYVPQSIFLADASVAENIALGVAKRDIDMVKIEECARMAQIHDFVMNEMPDQYYTTVGERGVRLSGGQRQRIGIARALYHNPSVLVLDEATSALDSITEQAVMESVQALSHQKTIIMIAHRLSTVRACDTIFMLDHGRLSDHGTYDELLASSKKFKAMV
ncbi:ABC transporter ATP-binding protein [Aquisediminimonas sediminicola]|uniref:ABC transporter ATP-binding protein n=1 Tax=Alteraquisediminimonas sediminicola TaxID=2676787 RepID=UPI001C8D9933|nr:ABC transporter ATP-binding protein [Aquisediminimonas sediminicola]